MKNLLLSGLLVVTSLLVQAQNENMEPNNTVYLSPFKLIKNGLQVDFAHRFRNRQSELMISPIVILGTIKDRSIFDSSPEWDIRGVGGEIQHRLYASADLKSSNFYLAHGPMYQYMSVDFRATDWFTDELDGQEVLVRDTRDGTLIIHKMGYSMSIGLKQMIAENFVIDGYVGLGFRFSQTKSSIGNAPILESGMTNYAYSGNVFVIGLRFGLILF